VDLPLVVAVIYLSLAGAGLGSLTGLAPGVHVNTLALALVSLSPLLLPLMEGAAKLMGASPGSAPLLMVTVIVSAAVAHSFLDLLPSIFLGAPEEGTALHVLPGHRLLLEGRALDAVASSAYGSLVGATVAVALCLPLAVVLGPPLSMYPLLDQVTVFLTVGALAALILSERGTRLEVSIRARSVERAGATVSLVVPVPVDGAAASLTGRAERDRWGRRWLATARGRWRLKGARAEGTVRAEGTWSVRRTAVRERSYALALLALSGALGLTCMNARLPLSEAWEGMGQSIMFPLLTGLFGLPGIIGSLHPGPAPPQAEEVEQGNDLVPGLKGALSGALVGWFPGISSTTGVIIASLFSRDRPDREGSSRRYLAMVSAVGTSSVVLGLLALAIAYKGRSGAMLAAKEVLGPDGGDLLSLPSPWLPLLLLSVLVASALSYWLVLRLGRRLARRAAGADLGRLNRSVLVLLLVLVAAFCGLPGLAVLGTATLLGLAPPALGVARVHLTGCLLLPVLLYQLGVV